MRTALLIAALLCGSCMAWRESPPAPVQREPVFEQTPPPAGRQFTQHVLSAIPNAGLLLPVISPDGQWIAYLGGSVDDRIGPTALFSGRGLEGVSLHLARTEPGARPRGIIPQGACWMAFSPDSRWLIALGYDPRGRCHVIAHEILGLETSATDLALGRLAAPAIGPKGLMLAVAAYADDPAESAVHVIDLARRAIVSAPRGSGAQARPIWLDEQQLLFVQSADGGVTLRRWKVGSDETQLVAELRISPPTPLGLLQAFAGIGRPLSPDGRLLAYYSAAADRMGFIDIESGSQVLSPSPGESGCWYTPGAFFIADAGSLRLLNLQSLAEEPILRGPNLPLHGDPVTQTLHTLIPGPDGWNFELTGVNLRQLP